MSKIPRFLVAENPMDEPEEEYVVHTQKPRFIAKFISHGLPSCFEIVEEIDNIGEFFRGDVSKIATLMRQLGDWHSEYCEWEENYTEEEDDDF